MSLGKATLVSLTSQIASLATTFLSGVIIARTLGVSGKGTYSLVVVTHAFTVLIGNLGTPAFVASTIGRRRYSPHKLISNSLLLFVLSTVLLACVFLAVRVWLSSTSLLGPFLTLLLFVVPLGFLREQLAAFLQGLNRIGRFSLTRIVGQLVTLILLLVFLLRHPSVWTAAYCWAAGEAVSVVVVLILVYPLAAPGISFSPSLLKESLRFGMAVWAGSLIGMASLRLDLYLVAFFMNAAAVGLYSVAATISSVILYLPNAMAIALLPRFSEATQDEAYELLARTCRLALLWGIGCALVLLAVGGPFIRAVYGSTFSSSSVAMKILLPGTVLYGVAYVTAAYFTGFMRKPGINAGLVAVSVVIGVALDLFLIPALGISGASLASTVAYSASVAVTLVLVARLARRPLATLIRIRKDDVTEVLRFLRHSLAVGGQ
jgi:O-antigen/teichoic acid export membrane protein